MSQIAEDDTEGITYKETRNAGDPDSIFEEIAHEPAAHNLYMKMVIVDGGKSMQHG